jgi:hypothetical protein
MFVIYDEKKYNIEKLSEHSLYFDTLKSNNFMENNNGFINMTHRGQSMKDILDMLNGDIQLLNLSSVRLNEMEPLLNELLVSDKWLWEFDENNCWNVISSVMEKERNELILKQAQEKEGKYCYTCNKINKWLIPNNNLNWDEKRDYCHCDYVRDCGKRISRREFLKEYYSSDENCRHGSSTW